MKDEFIYTEEEAKALVYSIANVYLDWVIDLINKEKTKAPNLDNWWNQNKK